MLNNTLSAAKNVKNFLKNNNKEVQLHDTFTRIYEAFTHNTIKNIFLFSSIIRYNTV